MEHALAQIKAEMPRALQSDSFVTDNVLSPALTRENLADFILEHLPLLLAQERPNCNLLLGIMCKAIYE